MARLDKIDGKPIVDLELAELGAKIKRTELVYREARRTLRALTEEADARVKRLMEQENLAVIDDGDRYVVVNPRPAPSEAQEPVLKVWEIVLARGDAALLDDAYAVCIASRCQYTNWTSEHGEPLGIAYARRKQELVGTDAVPTPLRAAAG